MSQLSSGSSQHVFLLTVNMQLTNQNSNFKKEPTGLGEVVTNGCTVFGGNESQNLWKLKRMVL